MKKCAKCNQTKDLSEFCNDKRSNDGKQSYCKSCKSELICEYYRANPEKRPKKTKKQKLASYYRNRVHSNISRLVRRGLKTKNSPTFKLLGYTSQQLKEHLEKQFLYGMNWDNYGKWHIDHKVPRAALPYQSEADENFKKCWALENLQPLWAADNQKKGAKFP